MKRYWLLLSLAIVLAGCQSTRDQMLAEGYPPGFADGYQDGCGSGREAAGASTGLFKKNVPRYLKEKLYAEGWTDGFRQCQAAQNNRDRFDPGQIFNDRDRAWEQEKTRSAAKAYRPN
ncbi:lipoprotein [Pseudomonas syringae]|uniref:lipoprotein n=1 Tax=Pseudomonas syringae TaxID=317 RepID=UPI000735FF44|nr:hypothetical protein [Pseudomonas syringae]KTB82475.1 hypothetical protein AO070_16340 [Pseudomonas syringae pv. syringae PD2766]